MLEASASSRSREARRGPGARRGPEARAAVCEMSARARGSPRRERRRARRRGQGSYELPSEARRQPDVIRSRAPQGHEALALDRHDLADRTNAGLVARDVRDDVHRESDMTRDRWRAELARPREQELEAIDRPSGGAGMDRRERPLVSGAERFEKRGGLTRVAHLSDQDPVGP